LLRREALLDGFGEAFHRGANGDGGLGNPGSNGGCMDAAKLAGLDALGDVRPVAFDAGGEVGCIC
jgi:hypothetical protein